MKKRQARKGNKRPSRTAVTGESREPGRKKRLADALRRNLGKRRNQTRQRGGS